MFRDDLSGNLADSFIILDFSSFGSESINLGGIDFREVVDGGGGLGC
jgi:hypothetical protein